MRRAAGGRAAEEGLGRVVAGQSLWQPGLLEAAAARWRRRRGLVGLGSYLQVGDFLGDYAQGLQDREQ